MAEQLGFVERLKRHHMFQIAAGYATVAYFLILVANAVFPDIGLTRGEVRYVIAILALGFPLALVFGWLFIKPVAADAEWHSSWQRLRWRIAPLVAGPAVALVTLSGIYLWHLNGRLADGETTDTTVAQAVAILPFDHSGSVDDSFMAGLKDAVATELSNAGERVIANDVSPTLADSKSPIADIAKATGATLAIRGSVQRADATSDYQSYFEVISATGGVTLDSAKSRWSAKADAGDVQKSVASTVASRVHLLSVLDRYFAPGYPTTKDAGALQLFHRGMLTYLHQKYPEGMQMMRAAVKLDPGFAQAHAYIAFYEASNPDPGLGDPRPVVEQEIAAAEKRDPALPEAVLARASEQAFLDNDLAGAIRTLDTVSAPLANSFNLHMLLGHLLRKTGDMQRAQHEYQAAAELDPYNLLTAQHVTHLGLALRQYTDTGEYLAEMRSRWPLNFRMFIGQAQVQFSEDGDLEKFAKLVSGDFGRFGDTLRLPGLDFMRLEVAHFQGKHADVIRGLQSIHLPDPGNCPDGFEWPQLSVQRICVAPFMAESLRLAGQDAQAAAYARLHAPEMSSTPAQAGGDDALIGNIELALLQAFGGDRQQALTTLQPVLARLARPVAQWSEFDGYDSLDAAVVLAWCGEQQQAVDVLTKSFDAPFGAHAALVARDPVWRPLYKNAAFTALLAAHGQTLVRTP